MNWSTRSSSSWNDGLALCAILDHYFPEEIHFHKLDPTAMEHNFGLALRVAEQRGEPSSQQRQIGACMLSFLSTDACMLSFLCTDACMLSAQMCAGGGWQR